MNTDGNCLAAKSEKMVKVCVIGGGPAGIMSVSALQDHCDVTCFERADKIGGQWGLTDEMTAKTYGTRQSSLYEGLWCNAPKEAGVEVGNFPWPTVRPSFVPGDEIRQYLLAYAAHFKVEKHIQTSTSVEKVTFDENTKQFSVEVDNMGKKSSSNFDYVVVATGHFHYPNVPKFEGEETFTGEMLHSHDFSGQKFVDKRVLCIGGSYSAEDICLLSWKNGAKFAHVTSRNPLPYTDWPETVAAKPILTSINNSTVTFSDGSTEDYDVIIKATGFVHKFPFLDQSLDPEMSGNAFAPNGLYKQCISVKNGQMFFLGMQNLAYTNPMFQLQACLLREVINGKFEVPDKAGRQKGFEEDLAKQAAFTSVFSAISFQTNYVNELAELTGEVKPGTEHIWVGWVHDKIKSIVHFRENNYESIYTGKKGVTEGSWISA